MSTILEVNHLKKYFPVPAGFLHAVDDVNLRIEEGKTLGVVGESGCGKSTLGRNIVRLDTPTEGEVIFNGRDIAGIKGNEVKELHKEMQLIFQDPFSSLDPRMTVSQLIGAPLRNFYRHMGSSEIQAKVEEYMDVAGLAKRFAGSYPHELDGGRRQRIGIARALILEPKFIVCDEPVSALDVSIQAQVLNLLQDLQENLGLTYMFITHDLSVVKHISDKICVMYLGQVIEMCDADELFRQTLHPYTKALLAAIPIRDPDLRSERKLLRGELSSPINPAPGCRFAPRCSFAKESCFQQSPELKEVCPGHMAACHYVKEINNI